MAMQLYIEQIIKTENKDNIKAPHYWSLFKEIHLWPQQGVQEIFLCHIINMAHMGGKNMGIFYELKVSVSYLSPLLLVCCVWYVFDLRSWYIKTGPVKIIPSIYVMHFLCCLDFTFHYNVWMMKHCFMDKTLVTKATNGNGIVMLVWLCVINETISRMPYGHCWSKYDQISVLHFSIGLQWSNPKKQISSQWYRYYFPWMPPGGLQPLITISGIFLKLTNLLLGSK